MTTTAVGRWGEGVVAVGAHTGSHGQSTCERKHVQSIVAGARRTREALVNLLRANVRARELTLTHARRDRRDRTPETN